MVLHPIYKVVSFFLKLPVGTTVTIEIPRDLKYFNLFEAIKIGYLRGLLDNPLLMKIEVLLGRFKLVCMRSYGSKLDHE